MEGFDVQDALQLLALGQGQNIIWSLFLYVIFFLSLITLFLIPDKNMIPTLLMAGLLLAVIIVKVSLAPTGQPVVPRTGFAIFILNIAMGAIPFIVTGMVRARHGKNKVAPPAILAGIFGFTYFFLYWLVVIRPTA